jgi:lipopolysaccharide export system permease protein
VVIFRYLAKEVFLTLIALTAILLLIFMSNQFVQYINRAAAGNIPGMIILKLMALEIPNLMGLLLPLGFYVSLLIAYGRLYAESEMTVLQACGYGTSQLFKHSFIMAFAVSVIVTVIVLWVNPIIALERAKLLRSSGVQTLIQTIVPGRFRQLSGQEVFYVENMGRSHTKAEHIFLARKLIRENKLQWNILWAEQAFAETDPKTYEDYVVLKQGSEYEGLPGLANYQIAQFDNYKVRLPHPTLVMRDRDIRTAPTAKLFPLTNTDRRKAAELQWRLSVPIMVFVLTLVAIPLSRVNPRSGKYAKILPAIVLYIIYANFMFVSRDWILAGKMPLWIGMSWLHFSVALVGLFLVWRNQVKLA